MADRITALKAMLEKDPDDPFCLYGLGMEYAKEGRHDGAASWFDLAIEADPDNCYSYFHKARSQQAMGNPHAACETLRIGLERAKSLGDSKAMQEISMLLEEFGEPVDDDE